MPAIKSTKHSSKAKGSKSNLSASGSVADVAASPKDVQGLFQKRPLKKEHQRIIKVLRDLAKDDVLKQKLRLQEYKEFLKKGPPAEQPKPAAAKKTVLLSFRSTAPFKITDEAKAKLKEFIANHPKGKVKVKLDAAGSQEMSLVTSQPNPGSFKIGSTEMKVVNNPEEMSRHRYGIEVVTDPKGGYLVFQFRYPLTRSRMNSRRFANQGDLLYKLRSSKS